MNSSVKQWIWVATALIGWATIPRAQDQSKAVATEPIFVELRATQSQPVLMQPEPRPPSASKPPVFVALRSPGPLPVGPLDHADVRYRILQHLGDIYVCYRSPSPIGEYQGKIDAFQNTK